MQVPMQWIRVATWKHYLLNTVTTFNLRLQSMEKSQLTIWNNTKRNYPNSNEWSKSLLYWRILIIQVVRRRMWKWPSACWIAAEWRYISCPTFTGREMLATLSKRKTAHHQRSSLTPATQQRGNHIFCLDYQRLSGPSSRSLAFLKMP